MEEKKIGRRKFLKTAAISTATIGVANAAIAEPVMADRVAAQASDSAAMPFRELGATGVKIPILHLGTSQRLDPVYDKVMHLCFKTGVTYFDTALSYGWGSSHRAIANFMEQIGDRKQLWLTSKTDSYNPKGIIADLDQCLEELKTDYLDLYLMHQVNRTRMLEKEFLRAGDQLRKAGKTRFFGFSCHGGNVVEVMQTAAKIGGIDAILFRYNFRNYGERELNLAIDACHKAGIGLLAMKTMGGVSRDLEKVLEFQSQNFTLEQAKLKSVWADERIASIASEMDSVKVARLNIAAAKSEKALTAEEVHQLNRLAALTAHYACNGCSHLCEAAMEGKIAIADPLRYLMYYEYYGKRQRAQELYSMIPAEVRRFKQEDLKKAAAVCPQGIDIAARLQEARSLLQRNYT